MTEKKAKSLNIWQQRRTTFWLSLFVIGLVGCGDIETDEPEHHNPAHRPADYTTAVDRLREVHKEILSGPLVVREIHATHHHHHHHAHDHHHSHGHDHSHSHDHEHISLDALQEMNDLVRWLPDLAADSDLKEEPWNRVHAATNALAVILTEASSQNGDERREAYLKHETVVEEHVRELLEIKRQFPSS